MNGSIRIGRIFGIPIYINLSFLFILLLFVWVFSQGDEILGVRIGFLNLDASAEVKYLFGGATAVIFFATILAHELAHSYVAIKYGVKIRHITLMIFGGVAAMEEIPSKPGQELRMAAAGPLTSLIIGVISYLMMIVVGGFGSSSVGVEGIEILLGIIGFYNILLAGFNMLPAFPMDGGRVLRSFLSTRMSHVEATKKAVAVAKVMAIAMVAFGILVGFNPLLIIIAIFVYIMAKDEERATVISANLEGVTVRQVMTDAVQVVHPDTSVQQLMDVMLTTRMMGYPVVDNGLVGIVTLSDTKKVPKDETHLRKVRDIMTVDVVTITPELPATDAVKIMAQRSISRLPVVDFSGGLVGIVTKKDFLKMVQIIEARKRVPVWGQPGWDQFQQRPPAPPPPQA